MAKITLEDDGQVIVPDKAELETFTKEQLNEVVSKVIEVYEEKINSLEDRFDKLAASMERDDTVKYVRERGNLGDPDIQVRGPIVDLGPNDPLKHLSAEHATDKSKYYRFVNNHTNIRSMRRYAGFKPVLDKDGNEVRYMDEVLMEMPLAQHAETIVAPREQRKQAVTDGIANRFHDAGASSGVQTFGRITKSSSKRPETDA